MRGHLLIPADVGEPALAEKLGFEIPADVETLELGWTAGAHGLSSARSRVSVRRRACDARVELELPGKLRTS